MIRHIVIQSCATLGTHPSATATACAAFATSVVPHARCILCRFFCCCRCLRVLYGGSRSRGLWCGWLRIYNDRWWGIRRKLWIAGIVARLIMKGCVVRVCRAARRASTSLCCSTTNTIIRTDVMLNASRCHRRSSKRLHRCRCWTLSGGWFFIRLTSHEKQGYKSDT